MLFKDSLWLQEVFKITSTLTSNKAQKNTFISILTFSNKQPSEPGIPGKKPFVSVTFYSDLVLRNQPLFHSQPRSVCSSLKCSEQVASEPLQRRCWRTWKHKKCELTCVPSTCQNNYKEADQQMWICREDVTNQFYWFMCPVCCLCVPETRTRSCLCHQQDIWGTRWKTGFHYGIPFWEINLWDAYNHMRACVRAHTHAHTSLYIYLYEDFHRYKAFHTS